MRHAFLQDLCYSLRVLRKAPVFTGAAVISLALGIGVNSAVFSVAEAALLKSWPGRNPSSLAKIVAVAPQTVETAFSYAEYEDIRARSRSFAGVLAYSAHAKLLQTGAETQLVVDEIVSPGYFAVLGVQPQLGTAFAFARASSAEPAVVISDGLWHRAFRSDPAIVGKPIVLTNKPYTVLGVVPPHFRGMDPEVPTDVWLLAQTEDSSEDLRNRRYRDFELLARRRAGVTVAQAGAELRVLGGSLAAAFPESNRGRTLALISERDRLRQAALPAFLLLSVAGLVLLISSANVAGLVLARSETRRREVAVRIALGAPRSRLILQSLSESALLAAAGAGLGLLLARLLFELEPALMPPAEVRMGLDLRLDSWVLSFTLGIAALSFAVFGLLPAFRTSGANLIPVLKDGTVRPPRRLALRGGLAASEVALSVVLLTASALLLRSFAYSSQIPLGLDGRKNLTLFDLTPALAGYGDQQCPGFFERAAESVRGIAGVKRAVFARRVPLSASGGATARNVSVPGFALPGGQPDVPVKFDSIAPGYLGTLGTRILLGRDFTAADGPVQPKVVLVSAAMARRFWPGWKALGRHILVEGTDREVVGIVEDVPINDVHETPEPYIYAPFAQAPAGDGTLVVETERDPGALTAIVLGALRGIDPKVPVIVRSMHSVIEEAFWSDRMAAAFAGSLSALGMFLAGVGLYGVIAHLAACRRREIAIRIAVGAGRWTVLRLVLTQGMQLAIIGVGIGVTASLAVTRLMSSLLYGVRPDDPIAFAGSAAIALLISLAAAGLPAWHAAKGNPMRSLRCE